MTKKDYQALAGALHAVNVDVAGFNDARPGEVLRFAVERIARVLAADSPRFDRETFVAACEDGNTGRRPKRLCLGQCQKEQCPGKPQCSCHCHKER